MQSTTQQGERRLAPTCWVPCEPRSPAEDRRRGREGCKAPKWEGWTLGEGCSGAN